MGIEIALGVTFLEGDREQQTSWGWSMPPLAKEAIEPLGTSSTRSFPTTPTSVSLYESQATPPS